jgi:ribonuclease Y
MEILVTDGRIHPTRIEEVVAEVEKEVEQAILEAGRDALFRLGLHPVHDEVLRLLGRLRFRQSYSQNILDHSIEVAHLAALMAAELDADLAVAKRAGLLHDIGKAINHEVEGSHALIGADFLKRHGEPEEIVNAVAAHHDEVPPNGIVAVLISAADALSASRPGARSESMTHYLKRLQGLEEIGGRFAGVDKCYAVQAGRELRVIVRPEELSDEAAEKLARDIAHRIEEELQYPGQIKVTVVRESRATTFAK